MSQPQPCRQTPSSYRNERLDHNSAMTVYDADLRLSTGFIGKKKA